MTSPLEMKVSDLIEEAREIADECLAVAEDDMGHLDTVNCLIGEIESCLNMVKINAEGVGQPNFTRDHASHMRDTAQELAGKALLLAAGTRYVKGAK